MSDGLTSSVIDASWRGLTRYCTVCGGAHLSFDLADGTVLRLRVPRDGLRMIAATVNEDQPPLGPCRPCRTQPESSSGNPQREESRLPTSPVVCPPARSSSAAAGE